jgi:S1-C subfamily serine protease
VTCPRLAAAVLAASFVPVRAGAEAAPPPPAAPPASAAAPVAAALAPAAAARPADLRAMASQTLARHAEAVATVRMVVKRRMVYQGRERGSAEAPMEVAGTILSPSGLTVVAESMTNPSGPMGDPSGDTRVDVETSDVKLVLRDGREIPARFVLRDADLDLAFLMPHEKGLKLPHVTLQKVPLPSPLDDIIFLFSYGRSLSREVAVATAPVRAVVKRPRTFLASDMMTSLQALGCPVFDSAGRALGIVVMRRSPTVGGGGGGLRDFLDMLNPVILTAADVAEVAEQVEP